MISKGKLSNFLILFSIVLVLLIPAFYAYSRGFQDVKYLLAIFPIFCIFSSFFIKNITEKIKFKKLFLILISILVVSSTVGFIEYKNSDYVNQVEAYEVAKEITKLTKVITYYSQGGYLDSTKTIEVNEFPILRKETSPTLLLYPDNYETFQEYISNNKEKGLQYVIVDKGDWRSKFLDDVFQNEESYPYLHKIFDSKDIGYKNYHAKIFKINFDEFNTLRAMEP